MELVLQSNVDCGAWGPMGALQKVRVRATIDVADVYDLPSVTRYFHENLSEL